MKRLTRVTWITEADQIGMRLEAHGIPFFVPEQYTASADPLLSHAMGGIDVLVHEKDYERAKAIIADCHPEPPVSSKELRVVAVILLVLAGLCGFIWFGDMFVW